MPSEENAPLSEKLQNRGLGAALPTSYATYVDRWAIVVGISKYKDKSLNLKYADRDAEALYELLLTPSGGGFEKEHVIKLVNEEATTANITRALRSFLKKPAKEDIVLIYFACHGAPDKERPEILYLITHDTDPDEIAGTGLPMREIKLSLRENLLAERVIMIADTCHSAGLSGEVARGVDDSDGAISLYLKEASEATKGFALLTSAAASQASFESEKWGGGHGVFTHFLLEGMRGAADNNPKNGVVTVRELFEYVRTEVKKATKDGQHPCIGNEMFDPNLPVTITAGISAQEHYELGCHLYQIGLKLDDKYCFESASRHLKEAIRQAAVVGSKLPEAHLQLGLTLTASGNLPKEAVAAFEKAIKAGLPDADYYLGIAYLNQGETEAARQHLEAFLSKQPDSDKAGAVQELISLFDAANASHSESVNRYALLIGINYSDLKDSQFHPLKGPVNDIEILNDVLFQKYGFKTTMLSDMEATYENIVKAFYELQERSKPEDVVIIYFAGYEYEDNLVAADTKLNDKGDRLNIITSKELYSLISAIPSLQKHLILDTCINSAFESFINQIDQTKICTLLLSSSLGQFSCEVDIEDTQKTHGYFTYTLVQELEKASENILRRTLFENVRKAVETKYPKQTPFFLGDLDKPLFFPDRYLDLFTFSQRLCYSAFDDCSLETLYQNSTKTFTSLFPDFYYSLGLAFSEKGNNAQALASLKTTIKYAKYKVEEKLFNLGVSQFKNFLYTDTLQTFQELSSLSTSGINSNLLGDLISHIYNLTKVRHCALLVGIDNYLNPSKVPDIEGAVNDTLTLKNILVNEYGFQIEDVKVLNNQGATYQKIVEAFKKLVDDSRTSSTFFYFAGRGSVDNQDSPTILAFDSRDRDIQDVLLSDLAQLAAANDIDLVSIIDSCWTTSDKANRFVECDENSFLAPTRKLTVAFDSNAIERDNSQIPRIGKVSIYAPSIKYRKSNTLPAELTPLLIKFLEDKNSKVPTYQELHQFYKDTNRALDYHYYYGVYFVENANIPNIPIFDSNLIHQKIQDVLIKIQEEPTQQAVIILKRLIEQRNGNAPEELFNLGIAYYILKQYDRSISALQATIEQVVSSNESIKPYPEAYYWLGRVLYESRQDPAWAVSELRLATQQDPKNVAAYYYLGKSLQALVEQEILTEAERAYQTYLNAGSPLGQAEEVQEFLRDRKKQQNI
jgi:tetratricopeptide (TPR) repeat protein